MSPLNSCQACGAYFLYSERVRLAPFGYRFLGSEKPTVGRDASAPGFQKADGQSTKPTGPQGNAVNLVVFQCNY